MPKCLNCNTDNHLDRKTCKLCDQALFSDEGQTCNYCKSLNGPFADNCRKCGRDFKSNITGNIQILLRGETLGVTNKIQEFKNKLQTSYLYSNHTFAGKPFSFSEKNNRIEFHFANTCYTLEKEEDLSDVFNMNMYEIPEFIKRKAYDLFKPLFQKHNNYSNIRLLSDNLGSEDVLLTFKNENDQLASLVFLPIFENEIKTCINQIEETCRISDSYFNAKENSEPIKILLSAFREYHYKYELIKKNENKHTYRIGNKTIHIENDEKNEALIIDYLNQTILFVKDDFLFLSILLLNWMINCNTNSMTIDERMETLTSKAVKQHSYPSSNSLKQVYLLPEGSNLVIEVKTNHVINIKFKGVSLEEQVPVHPNMEKHTFEHIILNYIKISNNTKIMKYIKMIEDSTQNNLSVSKVNSNSCYIHVSTRYVLMSSIYLTEQTSFDEVMQFIKKIDFIEQIIEN